MLSNAFFSIVRKDCPSGHLLVRARRPGDIEKIFGRRHKVERDIRADYLYRARVPVEEVADVLRAELQRVAYPNFKDSVRDEDLHHAYLGVWTSMATVQDPPPYSGRKPIAPAQGRQAMSDMVERAGGANIATEEDLDDTADLVGEYDGALLTAIEIVEKAAKQPLSPRERERLAATLSFAKSVYDCRQLMAYYARKVTIHDIAEPLAKVIEVLEDDDVDGYAVLAALSAPPHMPASPHREEREILLQLLRKLAANLPPAPAKRTRGQPMARDLYELVEWLAKTWEHYTGIEFTRGWGKGKPSDATRLGPDSHAMHFACAVVKVIDEKRLDELPTVTKNVVTDRRKRRAKRL
jgi:hypothetical protein